LLVGTDGNVSEGALWNVGFVRPDGQVIWPGSDALPGVTLALVRAEYERCHPGESSEQPVPAATLGEYAAAFTTNAVGGVRPVHRIDKHILDPASPVVAEMARWYADVEPEPI
jgi:branched-subunit amino acid aminotransferase/4-amino-4-deoxychorismate lyase